nr:ATP-binding cassette domain-containing protein [Rhizobium leguminosarum]
MSIKTAGVHAPVSSLSGGNQQRVVLAKALARNPQVVILNGPTVGVDVGSKDEIHQIIAVIILQLLSTGFNMLLLYVSDGNFFRDFVWGFLLLLIMSATSVLRSKRR